MPLELDEVRSAAAILNAKQVWDMGWYVDLEQFWERHIMAETCEDAMDFVRKCFPGHRVDFTRIKAETGVVVP